MNRGLKYFLAGLSAVVLLVWVTSARRDAFPKANGGTLSVLFSGGALGALEPCG